MGDKSPTRVACGLSTDAPQVALAGMRRNSPYQAAPQTQMPPTPNVFITHRRPHKSLSHQGLLAAILVSQDSQEDPLVPLTIVTEDLETITAAEKPDDARVSDQLPISVMKQDAKYAALMVGHLPRTRRFSNNQLHCLVELVIGRKVAGAHVYAWDPMKSNGKGGECCAVIWVDRCFAQRIIDVLDHRVVVTGTAFYCYRTIPHHLPGSITCEMKKVIMPPRQQRVTGAACVSAEQQMRPATLIASGPQAAHVQDHLAEQN